jgi:mevalonate kinase
VLDNVLGRYRACGKLILLGEHFVVHGAPAIALPLPGLGTEVSVLSDPALAAACLDPPADELADSLLAAALAELGLGDGRGLRVKVSSTLPIGYGVGSSASFAVALLGALSRAAGAPLPPAQLGEKAHALEHLSHGQPSGIDDTVVTFERPIWFRRGEPPVPLTLTAPPRLLLAGSGRPGCTRDAVASVARLRASSPGAFDALHRCAVELVNRGRAALEAGDSLALGGCLDETHGLLQRLGVSSSELDRLVAIARGAGALGAKLTGSGLGGFVVALAPPGGEAHLREALEQAGAHPVTQVGDS